MVWVVVAVSCTDCNAVGVQVFDHEPTEPEVEMCRKAAGGMYCFNVHPFKCDVNGPAAVGEINRGW
jgi:hypothetical protein